MFSNQLLCYSRNQDGTYDLKIRSAYGWIDNPTHPEKLAREVMEWMTSTLPAYQFHTTRSNDGVLGYGDFLEWYDISVEDFLLVKLTWDVKTREQVKDLQHRKYQADMQAIKESMQIYLNRATNTAWLGAPLTP